MFDVNSQERQAHHQFMSLADDQHKEVANHELFGNAAAYHAATSYTDHCMKNGVPENTTDAQNIMLGYANDFVNNQVDSKGLKLDKSEAMKHATQSLQPQMSTKAPVDWQVTHPTPARAFDTWKGTEKQYMMPMKNGMPDYEMMQWAARNGVVF